LLAASLQNVTKNHIGIKEVLENNVPYDYGITLAYDTSISTLDLAVHLFYFHSWPCAFVRREEIRPIPITCGQYHPFGYAEFHLARRKVGYQDGQAANELFRIVSGFYSREDVTSFRSDIQRELQ
jgi:hypothetical protein